MDNERIPILQLSFPNSLFSVNPWCNFFRLCAFRLWHRTRYHIRFSIARNCAPSATYLCQTKPLKSAGPAFIT